MKVVQFAVPLFLAASAFASGAKADSAVYSTVAAAQTACAADTVVWIDLDRGRYYKVGQTEFAKSNNGVYACEHVAHAKYREGKSDTSAVASK